MIAISNVYTSDCKRVFFFSDDPSDDVWYVVCREGYEETKRCPMKDFFVRIYATPNNEINGLENGFEHFLD